MTSSILVIADVAQGKIRSVTREACTAARIIAESTGMRWGALVLGKVQTGLEDVPELIQIGTRELADASPDVKAAVVAEQSASAAIILMVGTAAGKDLMGRIGQHLDVPLATDCVGVDVRGQKVYFTRSLHGGKVLSTVRITARPIMATFRPRTFGLLPQGEACVSPIHVDVDLPSPQASVTLVAQALRERLDVTEADIVVSGGRGMQGPEHWPILEDLVAVLGPRAALACSRPVSDDGWRPRSEHVGQTGRAIAPDLYIACGISGAIQHVAGIVRSKCIIAINKDPQAPIFKVADYGIVGDLFEVVPALTAAIKALS